MFDALAVPQALSAPQAMCSHTDHSNHVAPEVVPEVEPKVIPDIPNIAKIKKASRVRSSKDTKKLRVAVVFSGRATCYDEAYEWYSKLSDKYEVDFYCSINTELNDYYRGFLELYSIKKYRFGTMDDLKHETPDLHTVHVKSMFYNLKEAVDMVSLSDYDVILYARADMMTTDDIDLSVAKDLDNVVFIPNGFDYGGINDQLAFGSPSAMFKYSHLYDLIPEYVVNGKYTFNAETTLRNHLESVGLEVRRFDLQYYLHPRRYDVFFKQKC